MLFTSSMSSLTQNSNKLFIENYKILQSSPEPKDARPSHNYHTVDLVSTNADKPNYKNFMLALNIDRSGSMGRNTSDGYTSLQYTLHTVKSIIDYLEEIKINNPSINLRVLINAFDDRNLNIGEHEIGKSKNKYLEKINKITPRGTTNIEDAFNSIFKDDAYTSVNKSEKAHILFTDGKPNVGKQSATGIVGRKYSGKQIYIGYGDNHDAKLLQDMAKIVNGDYHFVDNIENAGMIYGEIIHSLLYAVVENISVHIKGAEVYDYSNNTWSNKINFNSFSSEHTQTLILRSNWDSVEPINVNVIYNEVSSNISHSKTDVFSEYNCTNGESKQCDRNIDVEKHLYRQKTMEILSKALTKNYAIMSEFKDEILCFEKGLKEFMKKKNLEDDSFMLKLVADIYITFKSIDSHVGGAFIGSRLNSQGCQRAYQVSDLSSLQQDDIDDDVMYSRSANITKDQMIAPKNIRQTSCYTTPSQARTMRSLTQPIEYNNDLIDAN